MKQLNQAIAPAFINITFKQGTATEINGKEFTETGINNVLGYIVSEYGLDSVSSVLASAKSALKENNGKVCMKFVKGEVIPVAA